MAGICIEFLYEETQIEVVVSSPMIGFNSGWGNAKLVLVMERCFRLLGKRVIERGPRKEKREARKGSKREGLKFKTTTVCIAVSTEAGTSRSCFDFM